MVIPVGLTFGRKRQVGQQTPAIAQLVGKKQQMVPMLMLLVMAITGTLFHYAMLTI